MKNSLNCFYFCCCILFTGLVFPQFAFSVEPLTLSPEKINGQHIGRNTEYFEDKEKKLSIHDITSPGMADKFVPAKQETFGLGFSSSALWVRLTVINTNTEPLSWFLEQDLASTKNIELYIPDGHGFKRKQIISALPSPRREIKSVTFIFPLMQNPGTTTYYLRLESDAGLTVALRCWDQRGLIDKLNQVTGVMFFFYGVLIVMIVYNLFISFSVKEAQYFYYIIKIACFMLLYASVDGVGQNYIYNGNQYLIDHVFTIALLVTLIMTVLFTRSYFKTRINTPRIDTLFLCIAGISLMALALSLFVSTSFGITVAFIIVIFGIIFLVFIIAPVYLKKSLRSALFFIAAYLLWLCGSVLRIVMEIGLLDSLFVYQWGPQIGVITMIVLFSLGLADKINTIKNELAYLNKNLEQKVVERTAELQAAMEELEAMNINLQSAMNELEEANEQLVLTRDALWGEMQLAKKIQTTLLPYEPTIPGYEIAAIMNPADEVGGDYYDVINVEGRDWLVIGDVSGHGVPSGLVMMMVQTSIQTALRQNSTLSPSQLLTIINVTITNNIKLLGENKYMTITVFAYIKDGTFYYSGLHQDILVFRKRSKLVDHIPTTGMWIGIMDDIKDMLSNDTLVLEQGDVMLLYTDGITEARYKSEEMYSEERLGAILSENGERNPNDIKTAIIDSLKEYQCTDDVTLLIVKRKDSV